MSAATTEAEIIEPKIEKAALLDDEGDLTAKVSSAWYNAHSLHASWILS